MQHSANLRKGRFSETRRVYLLTAVTADRAPVFADFAPARQAVLALRGCDLAGDTHTLCYVLMPDHLHWLLELRSGSLSDAARRYKSTSSRMVNLARQTGGARLWQPGFHDHALRDEEDMADIARYVVANPLRAGLVARIGDYPHWDAIWL